MLKKLTAKVQQLNPVLEENVNGFAKSFVIEPESQELLLKKGSLYVVFDISGNTRFEVSLITNVVHDMLHDLYYQSANISPIQSLEKTITEIREKVVQLANESIIIEKQEIEFNIVVGALWGNVMYVVQYGSSKSFLMRVGDIKPISSTSEGNFSAASGVVKDEDVLIFASNEFTSDYPPDRLLKVAIPEGQLKPQQACMLMKFIIDTNFTQNEIVDFGTEAIKVKKETPKIVGKVSQLFSKLKTKKPVKTQVTATIATVKPVSEIGVKLKKTGNFKLKLQYIIPLLAIALGVSIFFTIKNNKKVEKKETPKETNQQQIVQQPTTPSEPEKKPEETDNTAYYDLKLTDPAIQPSNVIVFTDYIVITDNAAGKIYISERETPKFTAVVKTFPGLSNVMNIKGQLGFTDNTGYNVMKLSDQSIVEDYTSSVLGVTSAYADYIYSIKDDKTTRYAKDGGKLTGTLWGQNAEMADVTSFGISYSLFMLKKDSTVSKYTSGEKDIFSLSGENTTLNNAVQLVADVDFDNIYVADAGNKRVISFDKNGKISKEYKAEVVEKWDNIKSISVSPDEKKLYVLTGTRIYESTL